MDLTPEEQPVRDQVLQAIEASLQKFGGFALNWSCIVEAVDADGKKSIWLLANEDARAWDVMGLLQYALTMEQAHLAHHFKEE